IGKSKRVFTPPAFDEEVLSEVEEAFEGRVGQVYQIREKVERGDALAALSEDVEAHFEEQWGEAYEQKRGDMYTALEKLKKRVVRSRVLHEGERIDGRDLTTVRPIRIDLGWLPRVHGSALFTRGETQASVTVTLGTAEDEQRVETLTSDYSRNFMLHYNFPPYSVGEARFLRGPGRREIGHGHLAERSFAYVLPPKSEFPYTIRVVSDITESNGSSSMASVCGGSLALMDAGVPMFCPVAGVAMGLIKEGEDVAVLTDILGDEDHLGDMDFKVTGTRQGVCAIQMDIKIEGLDRETLEQALQQAYEARLHILNQMDAAIDTPREHLSKHAPKIVTLWVKPERIRDIIGPGGKMIRSIAEETGVKLDIEDSGRVRLASADDRSCQRAIELIESITRDVEVGKVYLGTVKAIKDFGAFVEVLPGKEGLLHISEIHTEHVERVTDILQEGDEVLIKVVKIDGQGKISLSRKEAIQQQAALMMQQEAEGTQPSV
ncbi:MAG: polyribonucleotide nucleotidyltransferase, partial [Myxococcota bacterium]